MRQTKLAAVLAAGIATFFIAEAAAQKLAGTTGAPASVVATHISPQALTGEASVYLKQLGTRLIVAGLESGTIAGTYTDNTGTSPMSLLWQNPGLLKLTIQSATAKTLTFNGTAATSNGSSTLSAVDQDLLNTLADDYPEAFFFSMAKGAANRMLGARFRTDDGKTPGYTGPFFAIYQKASISPANALQTTKMFVFSTATGLLDRVTYLNGQGSGATMAEVQYSGWQSTNGQAYPGKIVRLSPSGVEFTLTFSSASFGPAVPAQTFTAQ